jgi:hypothetical protein
MSTINSIKKQNNEEECNSCVIGFAWAEIETCDPIEIIWRPTDTNWPSDPNDPEYESFERATAYVSPQGWDREQSQSMSPDCNMSYSEPYSCITAATNVRHASGPKIETKETYLRNETLNVNFYWYGAKRNPLYPGTPGAPPYIREIVGPKSVSKTRRVYSVEQITTDIYGGRIQCTCGEPSECGC